VADKTFEVERAQKGWLLYCESRIVVTRDLAAGIDELVGKKPANRDLAMEIIFSWDLPASSAGARKIVRGGGASLTVLEEPTGRTGP
jgi:hypothetical protein